MHFLSLLAREGFGQEELRSNFCPRWQGMGLVNACNLGFIAGKGVDCSTHFEIHFDFADMEWVCSTLVEIYFV